MAWNAPADTVTLRLQGEILGYGYSSPELAGRCREGRHSVILRDMAPVAVGGLGRSGTRALAMVLQGLGVSMGHDLNAQKDDLRFTLLFKPLYRRSSTLDGPTGSRGPGCSCVDTAFSRNDAQLRVWDPTSPCPSPTTPTSSPW